VARSLNGQELFVNIEKYIRARSLSHATTVARALVVEKFFVDIQ